MKKFVSNALLAVILTSAIPSYAAPVETETKAGVSQSRTTFDVLFSNYKKAVIFDGISNDIASAEFLKNVQIAQISVADVKDYALHNMSFENYLKFEKALDSGLTKLNGQEISEKKMAKLVEQLLAGQQREGANWISCGAGLGIGIPLLVAGVVTTIVALALKEVKVSTVEREYIDRRKKALDQYTDTENKRQDSIVTRESDIAAYKNEIAELERRINSGAYGALEEERMKQYIAALNVSISDSQAAIAQLINDQPQLYASYKDQISYLSELEFNEVQNVGVKNEMNRRTKKTLGITAAIAMPLGLALTLSGAKECN